MNPSATKTVSFSELDSYRQCRLKHHLSYRERWQPEDESPALSRGKLFHAVMEEHYKALKNKKGIKGALNAINDANLLYDPKSGQSTEEQELVNWIYEGYVQNYGIDDDWKIIDTEFKIEAWLPTAKGTRSTFKLKGTIDLLVQDMSSGGGLWVVDHKTCRNLPKSRDIDLDDQMALYIYLLRRKGLDVRGAIYNACRSQKLKTREMGMDERFSRILSVRTDVELENIAAEVLETFREAYRPRRPDKREKQLTTMNSGNEQINENLPPRSPDPDRCGWRCPFTEACLMGRKGTDIRKVLGETGYVQNFERH